MYLLYSVLGMNTCRCRIKQQSTISVSGFSFGVPIAITFACVVLTKVHGTFYIYRDQKELVRMIHRVIIIFESSNYLALQELYYT